MLIRYFFLEFFSLFFFKWHYKFDVNKVDSSIFKIKMHLIFFNDMANGQMQIISNWFHLFSFLVHESFLWYESFDRENFGFLFLILFEL